MFNREQAIADWRKQMLNAGIQTPALAELEAHLREDIARQTKSGLIEAEAFAFAVQMVGPPAVLNREFTKNGGFYDFLSKRRTLKITLSVTKLLGLVWLIFLWRYSQFMFFIFHLTDGKSLITLLIVFAAFVGSVLLIFDSKLGRKIVRVVALTCLATWVIQDCLINYTASHSQVPNFIRPISFHNVIAEQGLVLAFMIVSVLVLHLPETANVRTTIKL